MTTSRHIKKIILLGDSTLDNYHWVISDPDATVAEQLKLKLTKEDVVINLAMDGFTTSDMFTGAPKNKAVRDDQHPPQMFYPLEELANIGNPSHIVLSVGGNDLRESLSQLIFTNPEDRMKQLDLLLRNIQDNYKKLIDQLKQTCPHSKIIVMLQYTPSLSPDHYFIYYLMQQIAARRNIKQNVFTYLDVLMYKVFGNTIKTEDTAVKELHHIMEIAYAPIIAYARENQIPILDMATTFDHTSKDIYVAQIEPGRQGAAIIANMITHVINTHDFNGPSSLYVKPGCTSGPVIKLDGDFHWRPHSIAMNNPQAKDYFNAEYQRRFKRDQSAWYGLYGTLFARNRINPAATVDQLVEEAQHGNDRSLRVMQDLGWLDEKKNKVTL